MSEATRVKLLAQEVDSSEYTTYVFEILDKDEIEALGSKYIMCTRWPNWDHRTINNNEEGYLSFSVIQAGIDKWFDGTTFVPYKYSNIQFNRFINKQLDNKHEFKL